MNKRGWFFHMIRLAAICCILTVGSAMTAFAGKTVSYTVKGQVDYQKSYECLKYVNKLRKSKGLRKLTMSKKLMGYALQRGAELSCAYSHTRPDDTVCFSLDPAWIKAENIAYGQETAQFVFDCWRNSPPHYRNMTNPDYRSAGIVCFVYDGIYYWVNLFGRNTCSAYKKSGEKTVKRTVAIAGKYLKKKNLYTNTHTVYLGSDTQMRLGVNGISEVDDLGRIGNSLFTYQSLDPSVLRVNAKGYLSPVQEGSARVTVCLKKNKKCRQTFTITVMNEEDAYIDPDYSDDWMD